MRFNAKLYNPLCYAMFMSFTAYCFLIMVRYGYFRNIFVVSTLNISYYCFLNLSSLDILHKILDELHTCQKHYLMEVLK